MRVGWKIGINGFTYATASIFRSTICTIKQRIYCLFCFLWQWILFPANLTTIWCWSRKVIFSIINLVEIFDWHPHLWLTDVFSIAFILVLSKSDSLRYLLEMNYEMHYLLLHSALVVCYIVISVTKMSSIASSWYSWPHKKQETILVGCIPTAWKPYVLQFQRLPPDGSLMGIPKWTSLNKSSVNTTRCH